MTTYRFIRIGGEKPIDEGFNTEFQIRACFEPCSDAVKIRLNLFLRSKDKEITFDFGSSKVIVRREDG